MRGFENRITLPKVLDEVHRRAVANKLARAGLNIRSGGWEELNELAQSYFDQVETEPVNLSDISYGGEHPFGPLLDGLHHLEESRPTDHALEGGSALKLGEWVWQREILIREHTLPVGSKEYPSRIILMPDSPPLAIHGDDYEYVKRGKVYPDRESDSEVLSNIETAFGPESVERVSEDVAGQVIYALLHDTAQVQPSKYH